MDIPEVGKPLRITDLITILANIKDRRQRFPNEEADVALGVILMNAGEQFARVHCVAGEWIGHKGDLEYSDDIPKCPNGHVLMQGPGLRLGWVKDQIP